MNFMLLTGFYGALPLLIWLLLLMIRFLVPNRHAYPDGMRRLKVLVCLVYVLTMLYVTCVTAAFQQPQPQQ